MKHWRACGWGLALLGLIGASAMGQTNALTPGEQLLKDVLAYRPTHDMSLTARLYQTRSRSVTIEILVRNTAEDIRTVYRQGDTELLVIRRLQDEPRFFLRGQGELLGAERMGRFLGSQFHYYDLGLGFLTWPRPKWVGQERMRGRNCQIVEVTATNQPYSRVKMWVDAEYHALLRAEAYDEDGHPVRRFAITSFRKVGDTWIPRGIDVAFVPPSQALPAEERSRLEMVEGDYNTKLADSVFDPARFAPVK